MCGCNNKSRTKDKAIRQHATHMALLEAFPHMKSKHDDSVSTLESVPDEEPINAEEPLSDSGGLSGGAIAGIVLGCLAALVMMLIMTRYYLQRFHLPSRGVTWASNLETVYTIESRESIA